MAVTGHIHLLGALLLLVSAILLLVATITSPVVDNLALLRIHQPDGSSITFGTFGSCTLPSDGSDICSAKHVGYHPSYQVPGNTGTGSDIADGLTGAMVLHPVACVIAFIAFLVSLGAGVIGSLVGFVVAAIAWVLTLIVMAIDFTLFAVVRNKVNNYGNGYSATYDTGIWCVLAAFVIMFFGGVIVLFTCCSARMRRRRDRRVGDRAIAHETKTDYGRRSRWGRWRR